MVAGRKCKPSAKVGIGRDFVGLYFSFMFINTFGSTTLGVIDKKINPLG